MAAEPTAAAASGHTPDVTVVVAVYNPGANIDGLLQSLHDQTLPAGALEVVLVDDGSTDGTRERLEALAVEQPSLVVRSIPNSGWPGRPRNVGLDAARGDYVFFADHDDEFFPDALSRMVSMARENGSDIVAGKIVRTGRPTPYWALARRDVPNADPAGDVLTSRTVHKLYRRQWLLDLGARFPEGRVRLEDHVFTAQVLPHARVVSVLASYPCYRWIHRPDGTNSSDIVVDPDVYWEFYSGVLRVFSDQAGPGRLLDEVRRHAAIQCFSRFPVRDLDVMTPDQRTRFVEAVRRYVVEQVPSSLDVELPVLKRLRLQALREGGIERFLALHRASSRLTARAELAGSSATWDDGRITVHAVAELVRRPLPADGVPVDLRAAEVAVLERVGDDVLVPLALLSGGAAARSALSDSVTSADRSLLAADRGALELTLRHRASGVEWPLPSPDGGAGTSTLVGIGDDAPKGAVGLKAQASAEIDPATAAFGRPLDAGIWDVLVRSQFLGEHQTRRLPVPEPAAGEAPVVLPHGPVAFAGEDGDLEALLYRTADGTLALKVTDPAARLASRPRATAYAWEGDHLSLHLALPQPEAPTELVIRGRGALPDEPEVVAPVSGGVVALDLQQSTDLAGAAVLDVFVRSSDGTEQRVAHDVRRDDAGLPHPRYSVYATAHGSLSLKQVAAPRPRSAEPPKRTGLRRLFGR